MGSGIADVVAFGMRRGMGQGPVLVKALNLVGVPEVMYIMLCEGVGWTCGHGMGKWLFL